MSDRHDSDLYNAYYFAHGCGRPYQRDEHWLGFFSGIADRIVSELQPKTVMDVGCAMGFLVEALRERGVEAFGIDISTYAIDQVLPEIMPYCTMASILDPLPQDYDLIVCIEVLEHLKPKDAERAINNLCKSTPQVLFSSTPSDFKEATHFNVQPPGYWAELFTKRGFFHDLDFDASFIAPWAMYFKREKMTVSRVVRNYELKQWQLRQEIDDLRAIAIETQNKIAAMHHGKNVEGQYLTGKDDALQHLAEELVKTQKSLFDLRGEILDRESLAVENAKLEALNAEIRSRLLEADEENRRLRGDILDYQKMVVENQRLEGLLTEEKERVDTLQAQLRHKEAIEVEKRKIDEMLVENQRLLELSKSEVKDLIADKESIEEERLHLESQVGDLSLEKQVLQGRLSELQAHVGWRLVTKIQRFRIRLFPVGSSRERIWKAGVAFFRAWLDLGFLGALRKALASIRGKPIGHTLDSEYQEWIKFSEPTTEDLDEQRESSRSLSYRPLISVITPVYNPPPHILKDALESILAQTYDYWEMCVADASTDHKIHQILEDYSQADDRINVKFLEGNEGIAGNSNHALKLAGGEFIAIFDHDDRLAPNALFEVVRSLNENHDIDILYFDEDKLGSDGERRRDPWFKPDWSPELLLSANYLMHSVVRRSLVAVVGGFNENMEGTQDWDLLLRCTERTKEIVHIPKVLYHWRQVSGSVASDLLAKPWVFENQRKCLESHLERIGIEAPKVDFDSPGFIRLSWPTSNPLVSIIIPSKDKVEVLRRCVGSLLEITRYSNYEIVLVDNESEEKNTLDYYETLKGKPGIRFVSFPGEFNFSAANNLGARGAHGDFLLFLNNDVEILEPEWLEELVRWAERSEIGVVGAKLLYPNGLIQHAGVVIGMQGHASHVFMGSMEKQTGPFGSVDWYRNYSAVTGACMMIRREPFEEIGGFDEGYELVFSDVEICLRVINNGYRIVYTPYARLRHYEGQSRGLHIPASDMLRGYEDMKEMVERGDPYFNENLSYESQSPRIIRMNEETRIARLERLIKG
jgi:GT2 family glycosyltransferase/2-polyprenyl-3-methyl-5-hydroxy-6-metoxy-1,4-benzoquinol methylase